MPDKLPAQSAQLDISEGPTWTGENPIFVGPNPATILASPPDPGASSYYSGWPTEPSSETVIPGGHSTINNDTQVAPNEAFAINLSGANNAATINKNPGTGAIADIAQATANFWVSEGPVTGNGSINGAVQAVAVHPTDPNIMYVGSVNGGIWKTTNATAAAPHWLPLTDNLPSLSIGALEFDPTDATHQTLIAGIGSTSSYFLNDQFTGVLRSTDGGATWSQLGTATANLGGENITSVAARGSILLASADNTWGGGAGKGLFRSTNTGVSWTLISDGAHGLPNLTSVSDVVGDPLDVNVLYAAVVGANGGVFKSTDSGLSWTNITSGIGIIDSTTVKIELAVHHDATNLAVFATVDNFVTAVNDNSLSGVFRSLNGASFVGLDVPSGGTQGNLHGAVTADPTNSNIVYVGLGGGSPNYLTRIDASKASGSQITKIAGGSFGSPHVDTREMQIDLGGNLVLGTDGGLFRLPNPTANTGVWSAIAGDMDVFEFHSIAYDHVSHIIMAGAQDNGTLFQHTAGSTTWDHPGGGDGGDVAIDDVSLASSGQSIRYFSSQNLSGWTRQVYDSANHLVSTTSLASISDSTFTTPVELNNVDATNLLVGGSDHIYASSDRGTSLTAIANVGVNDIGFGGGGVMVYGGFQGTVPNPDLVYAASGSNVVKQTAASGGFTTTSPGGSLIRGITDNPVNWVTVFAIDDNQIFESTNAGATWADVTGNLTSISAADFRSIEYVHGAVDDALVVGTSSGVFDAKTSGLGGAAPWSKFGSNLPDVITYDLEYDPIDDVLVAGTMGRGAWLVNNATVNLTIGTPAGAVSINDVSVAEGDSGTKAMTFTVTRSGGSAAFDVNYATSDGTATVADADYQATSGTLHFGANVSTQTVSVTINGDTKVEPDEQFSINLSGATNGATISDGSGLGTILNDDVPVAGSVSINDVSVTEGDSGTKVMSFTVGRINGTAAFDVNYATSDGTATVADGDYQASSGTLNFGANVSTQTVSVTINGDTKVEPDEQFSINLSGATNGAAISDGAGVGTILNDDNPVAGSVSINDVSVTEGDSGTKVMSFTVGRINGTAAFNVNYATSDGTATVADADYQATSGTLHFGANVSTQTVSVTINGDTKVEPDEQFSITLSGATNGATISDGSGVGTILNDDESKPDLTVAAINAPVAVSRGAPLNFTYTVQNTPTVDAGAHFAGIMVDRPVDQNNFVDYDFLGSLLANSSRTIGKSLDTTNLAVGPHTLNIGEDFTNQISETREDNNLLAVNFRVNKPPNDFNADGESDVLWRGGDGTVAMWQMNGFQIKNPQNVSIVGREWTISGMADFDKDGKADVLWRNTNTGAVAMWEMNGAQIKAGLDVATVPLNYTIAGTPDVDGDGKADILWRNTAGDDILVSLMNGAAVRQTLNVSRIGSDWSIAGTGDVDGDRNDDVIWRNTTTGAVAVWEMNGAVIKAGQNVGPVGLDWKIAGVGDIDGDGKTDIRWRQDGTGADAMWLLNGFQVKDAQNLQTVGPDWSIAGTPDLNGDGQSDVLWRQNGTGTVAAWLSNVAQPGSIATVGTSWSIVGALGPNGKPNGGEIGDGSTSGAAESGNTVSGSFAASAGGGATAPAVINTAPPSADTAGSQLALAGNATVWGGAGVAGGAGQGGNPTVTGFSGSAGQRISFPNQTPAAVSNVITSATTAGGNTLITLPDGSQMTLAGVTRVDNSFFR